MTSTAAASEIVAQERPEPSLGLVGRVALAAVVVLGFLFGSTSPVALFWFVCDASVAAILVVRRPRALIGWILLAAGCMQLLAAAYLPATVEQFTAGPPPALAAAAWLTASSSVLVFGTYSLLAFVFPSPVVGQAGRLARGPRALCRLRRRCHRGRPRRAALSGWRGSGQPPEPVPGLPHGQDKRGGAPIIARDCYSRTCVDIDRLRVFVPMRGLTARRRQAIGVWVDRPIVGVCCRVRSLCTARPCCWAQSQGRR